MTILYDEHNFGNHMINTNATLQFVPDRCINVRVSLPLFSHNSPALKQTLTFSSQTVCVRVQACLSVWWKMCEKIFRQLLPPAFMLVNTGYS